MSSWPQPCPMPNLRPRLFIMRSLVCRLCSPLVHVSMSQASQAACHSRAAPLPLKKRRPPPNAPPPWSPSPRPPSLCPPNPRPCLLISCPFAPNPRPLPPAPCPLPPRHAPCRTPCPVPPDPASPCSCPAPTRCHHPLPPHLMGCSRFLLASKCGTSSRMRCVHSATARAGHRRE